MKTDRTQPVISGEFVSHQSIFNVKGDTLLLTIPSFHRSTYPIRHVVVSGAFKLEFPNTELNTEIINKGEVWPLDHNYPVNSYRVTSIEDNSSYYCVNNNGDDINLQSEENLIVLPNTEIIVPENSMLFVFGEEYVISGNQYLEDNVFTTTINPVFLKTGSKEIKYTRVYK